MCQILCKYCKNVQIQQSPTFKKRLGKEIPYIATYNVRLHADYVTAQFIRAYCNNGEKNATPSHSSSGATECFLLMLRHLRRAVE